MKYKMANVYEKLQNNPEKTKGLLGISYENLMALIEVLLILEMGYKEKIEEEKTRLNEPGGGAKKKLTQEDEIIVTLIYLRQGLTFESLGFFFDLGKSTANNAFNYWMKIWEEALPPSLVQQVKNSGENEEKLLKLLKDYELIVDRSEQPRQRPVDNQQQKDCYSKKTYTHN